MNNAHYKPLPLAGEWCIFSDALFVCFSSVSQYKANDCQEAWKCQIMDSNNILPTFLQLQENGVLMLAFKLNW